MRSLLLLATCIASTLAASQTNSTGTKNANNGPSSCSNQKGASEPIRVHVGSPDGTSLKYYPDDIQAQVGQVIEFIFHPKNHTVTESSFADPCKPLAAELIRENRPGVRTGFVPVTGTEDFFRTFSIMINDTKPMWLYCGQGKHCQAGMNMVINRNTSDTSKTLEKYREVAAQIPAAGASSSATTTSAATITPITPPTSTTPAASGPALASTAASPLVSVFTGAAMPTQRPVGYAALGGLAVVGAVALL